MLSIEIFLAVAATIGLVLALLRALRSDPHGRSSHFGGRHDMVDWTLEWRRALKSLESQGPASGRSARR